MYHHTPRVGARSLDEVLALGTVHTTINIRRAGVDPGSAGRGGVGGTHGQRAMGCARFVRAALPPLERAREGQQVL